MAEQVNQRIEDMINELEQMQRTNLYSAEEIREISRRRKEFEYKIQRQTKHKEDFISYIAYDMALLEDITIRRKEINLKEKKNDIEYTIAKRMNKIFKQFIYRFQNDIEVYFQYIKFCKGVGFDHAISGIIGQMLQIHGDKPKMWQMASKWEYEELKNVDNARSFLLKGIHRHPDAETLYLDLFNLELVSAISENEDGKEKQVKRATVVWNNASKNIPGVKFLFKLCDIAEKFDFAASITSEIRSEIWLESDTEKEVWSYVAAKELKGIHWAEVEDVISEDDTLPGKLMHFVLVYEAALQKFSDETLCTRYIHELLKLNEKVCTNAQLVSVIKRALLFAHDWRVLSDELYVLWIDILKEEGVKTTAQLQEILEIACMSNPSSRLLWQERVLLRKDDEEEMEAELNKANNKLKTEDMVILWNILIDNNKSKSMIKKLYEKVCNCDSAVLLSVKPKLLQKTYDLCGIKSARTLYNEFLRAPPLQVQVHNIMISLELREEIVSVKSLRKCYEAGTHNFGKENVNLWLEYIEFEITKGDPMLASTLYQRAIATLKPELVDKFIELNTLGKIKVEDSS